MLHWAGCPIGAASLLFFDIETTGLRPDRGARITEIAVVDHAEVRFDWRHDAGTPDDATLSAHLLDLFDCLRTGVVVGHNVGFDFQFIAYEADRLGHEGPTVRFIDTLGLARRLLGDGGDYRLETLLERFDLVPDGDLHTALVDAQSTRALFWQLVDCGKLETLADAGLQQLNWTAF